jgi:hypothetical protein
VKGPAQSSTLRRERFVNISLSKLDFGCCGGFGGDSVEGAMGNRAGHGPRWRADGFTPEKRRIFLSALAQYGCFTDAAKVARVSRNSVLRHRRKWPDFAQQCDEALKQAAGPLVPAAVPARAMMPELYAARLEGRRSAL